MLKLLTPITSPMVTRPTSPSGGSSAEPDSIHSAAQHTAQQAAQQRPARPTWKSPPCCDGCGAAKASGGRCTGCGGSFCASCMGSASSAARGGSAKGACSNCSALCNTCKPVACSFCQEARQQPAASRLCEACAGVCDACQRAACSLCRAEFSSCSSCGFSACMDCMMQQQLQVGAKGTAEGGSLVGPTGTISCWCAPPLRMASNVRHVSSQRYQMSQLHPSMLAASMEAAGLRDADYDEYDDVMGFETSSDDDTTLGGIPAAAASATDADAAVPVPQINGHSHSLGSRGLGSGLAGTRSPQTLAVTIGSLPGLSSHLSLPLSPASSSHSSLGHYGSAGGALGQHGLLGVRGYGGSSLRIPEHSLRGWLDGMS